MQNGKNLTRRFSIDFYAICVTHSTVKLFYHFPIRWQARQVKLIISRFCKNPVLQYGVEIDYGKLSGSKKL